MAAVWSLGYGILGLRRAGRAALTLAGGAAAAFLLLVIPDQRPLTALAYAPFALVAAPFGLLPVSYFDVALRASGLVWAGAYLATFAALGGCPVLGLTYRWGEIWPRWVIGLAGRRVPPALPIGAATTVAAALAATGGVIIRVTDWTDVAGWLGNPLFYLPVWAVALGVATLAYRLRTRGRCRACGRGEDQDVRTRPADTMSFSGERSAGP